MELIMTGTNECDEDEWDDLCEGLTELMDGGCKWRVFVSGFGWRGVSGSANIRASSGRELLTAILPRTGCRFKVYLDGSVIKIDNSHHDKPCGGEWYSIEKA